MKYPGKRKDRTMKQFTQEQAAEMYDALIATRQLNLHLNRVGTIGFNIKAQIDAALVHVDVIPINLHLNRVGTIGFNIKAQIDAALVHADVIPSLLQSHTSSPVDTPIPHFEKTCANCRFRNVNFSMVCGAPECDGCCESDEILHEHWQPKQPVAAPLIALPVNRNQSA
jgi:hypothetical protein